MGGATVMASALIEDILHFNPRSPWGERLLRKGILLIIRLFQSTLPVGGATILMIKFPTVYDNFNPRSPWGERQYAQARLVAFPQHFNPRSPWGERQQTLPADLSKTWISIHAPRGGSDTITQATRNFLFLFQSTLPVGGATPGIQKLCHH